MLSRVLDQAQQHWKRSQLEDGQPSEAKRQRTPFVEEEVQAPRPSALDAVQEV